MSDSDQPTRPDPDELSTSTPTRAVPDLQKSEPVTRSHSHSIDEEATQVHHPGKSTMLVPGLQLGDFALEEVLGSGAFATVYRATQISLGREVALKVTRIQNLQSQKRDYEARTLGALGHEHIVRVYSVEEIPDQSVRLLCMSFVAGTDLDHVIRALKKMDPEEWSGRAIVEAVDQLAHEREAMFDLASIRARNRLEQSDFIQAVCWMGARLAEALSHAHRNGVLHRDIKPANILIDRYGRPLLSDFNLATMTEQGLEKGHFGGTIRYMAPEHLDAFNPTCDVPHEAVNELCDVYSLGVVLYEFLTGTPPFKSKVDSRLSGEILFELAKDRRENVPSARDVRADVPIPLNRVIRRCLAPDPKDRYDSAEELVDVLEGCRELRHIERQLPPPLAAARSLNPRHLTNFLILVFLPHLIAEVAQIAYNSMVILPQLDSAQRQVFYCATAVYNVLVYGAIVCVGYSVIMPVLRCLNKLSSTEPLDGEEVRIIRQQALHLPLWTLGMSILGWLPGGFLFPWSIDLFTPGNLSPGIYVQFLVSFGFAGLLATTYACFAVEAIVIRLCYPYLWVDPKSPRKQARKELRPVSRRLGWLQFAAALIPLSGAILMVSIGSVSEFTLSFRLFVVGLISVGMLGFGWALFISTRIGHILEILSGSSDNSGRTSSHTRELQTLSSTGSALSKSSAATR